MNIKKFVNNCIKEGLEFNLAYIQVDKYEEYCLHMILGNEEHIIPVHQTEKLHELWYNNICVYWR